MRLGRWASGTPLIDPHGRKFTVGVQGGCDSQGRPVVQVHRRDRRKGEQLTLTRPAAEVDGWQIDSEAKR